MNTENNYIETDLGNVALNPRGEYDSSAAYEYLDAVSYQGGSYFCLAELETTITGIAPDSGHNSEHWQMIALPGDMTVPYTECYCVYRDNSLSCSHTGLQVSVSS